MTGSELVFLFITTGKNKQIKQRNKNKSLEEIEINIHVIDASISRIFKE